MSQCVSIFCFVLLIVVLFWFSKGRVRQNNSQFQPLLDDKTKHQIDNFFKQFQDELKQVKDEQDG